MESNKLNWTESVCRFWGAISRKVMDEFAWYFVEAWYNLAIYVYISSR